VVDRSRLPESTAPRAFEFPAIQRSVLPSGLRIWTVPHAGLPILSVLLLLRTGSANDPDGQEGLAALTADMLDEGSGSRTAIEMHEDLARIGAHLDADISPDASTLTVSALSRFADRALMLLADMVARPALTEADVHRVRQLRLHRLTQLRDIPSAVAERTFARLLYGGHPYGHGPIGTERSVAALQVDDVRAFHARMITPDRATLIACGDCDHAEIEKLAAAAFAGWVADAVPGPASHSIHDSSAPALARRVYVVPRPGAPQSELRIGHVAVARDTPDYHALVAANMVLGGQFVSRINANLREDKGFTYGARTSFDFRRMPGPFTLQTSVQTAVSARAIEESLGELEAIRGPRPVTSEELSVGVAALTRGFAKNFETGDQIARAAVQMALYDLPDDYFAQYVPRVEAVTAADVTHVCAERIDPQRFVTLVVGDLDVIGADLPRLGFGDPIVLSPDVA
jgi:predicted Zn-dependent peptidase